MKSMLKKDTYREIKKSMGRFLSIFAIVALGVAFFSGIKVTSPDMRITADKYFKDYNLMDLSVISTIGFNNEDIAAIKKNKNVIGVMPSYSMDVMTTINNEDFVLKLMALPLDKINTNSIDYMNRPKLLKGRLPANSNECVAEQDKILKGGFDIGSKIKLTSGTDKDINESLKNNEYTIVGIVQNPYFISHDRGASSIGSGKINNFIMIPQDNFKLPAYNVVFLKVKGLSSLNTYDSNYKDVVTPIKKSLEAVGSGRIQMRYKEIMAEGNAKLEEKKTEYSAAQNKSSTQLKSAADTISNSKTDIDGNEKLLDKKEEELHQQVRDGQQQILEGRIRLEDGEEEYARNLKKYNDAKPLADIQIADANKKIELAQNEIKKNQDRIAQLQKSLNDSSLTKEQKTSLQQLIDTYQGIIDLSNVEIESKKNELQLKELELKNNEADLKYARKTLDSKKQTLDANEAKLNAAKTNGENAIATKRQLLKDGKSQLVMAQQNYDTGKSEAESKLAEAKNQLITAENQLKAFSKPIWYVLDRQSNSGFSDYGMAADRIMAISKVFPVIFYIVAALVCLTTMTRMVDEQRTNIGTLKALGYEVKDIAYKYIVYAATASISGSILGVAVGFTLIPAIIFNAYNIMYRIPNLIRIFHVGYAMASSLGAILITTLAAFFACNKELMLVPANLMRPKAPKMGKKLLIEKIDFIWSRLSFIRKVTARNIFRYKKRLAMTVLGIAGCTALLLAGFGLKDSIKSIVTNQFGDIYRYNLTVAYTKDVDLGSNTNLLDRIRNEAGVDELMTIKLENINVSANSVNKSCSLIVPDSEDTIDDFIKLRVRGKNEKITLGEEGVVVTEKLANMLKIKVGDEVNIKNEAGNNVGFKVSGIAENYVSHYIYISKSAYEKKYGTTIRFDKALVKTADQSDAYEKNLSSILMKDKNVIGTSFNTVIKNNFKDAIKSLDYIIYVIIVSAGALAFIVLYNLTNINISERLREIATLKVLGFYDNEVAAYVYRENLVLTFLGMLLGLVLGIFLNRFIVSTAEIEFVMFGRNITNLSFLYAALLTIIFTALVNIIIYFKLKKIPMVESLKSVD